MFAKLHYPTNARSERTRLVKERNVGTQSVVSYKCRAAHFKLESHLSTSRNVKFAEAMEASWRRARGLALVMKRNLAEVGEGRQAGCLSNHTFRQSERNIAEGSTETLRLYSLSFSSLLSSGACRPGGDDDGSGGLVPGSRSGEQLLKSRHPRVSFPRKPKQKRAMERLLTQTSLMSDESVRNMTSRSMPIPQPVLGGQTVLETVDRRQVTIFQSAPVQTCHTYPCERVRGRRE